MRAISMFILGVIGAVLISCGEGKVVVTNESYEPRIAVEGYLIAGQKVDKIRIARNFRLDDNLRTLGLLLPNAQVTITEMQTGRTFPLRFHSSNDFDSNYFLYDGDDLIIEPGKSYRLDVTATIEGKELSASSTTTVPSPGFQILEVNFDNLQYRQRDNNDNVLSFALTIARSPGTTFYAKTITALGASPSNFVYDNPFFKRTPEEVASDINDFNYQLGWIQDTPNTPGQSQLDVFWFELWFYTDYEVVVYAGDKNYKDFFLTYNDVQEEDGNFHEAKFNFEGDGVGVFGSMIADTVRILVTQ